VNIILHAFIFMIGDFQGSIFVIEEFFFFNQIIELLGEYYLASFNFHCRCFLAELWSH
jgi:hypothetical protein